MCLITSETLCTAAVRDSSSSGVGATKSQKSRISETKIKETIKKLLDSIISLVYDH